MAVRRFEEAVKDLDTAVGLLNDKGDMTDPSVKTQMAQLITTRARVYQAKGDIEAAYRDFDKAVKIAPNQRYVIRSRGFLHFSQKKWDLAIADLSTAIKASPNDAEARLALARSYELTQKGMQSLDQYEQVTQLRPQDIRPLLGMASVRLSNDPRVRDASKAVEHSLAACELTNWKQAAAVKAALASHTAAGKLETALKLFDQHQDVFDPEARKQIEGELQKLRK